MIDVTKEQAVTLFEFVLLVYIGEHGVAPVVTITIIWFLGSFKTGLYVLINVLNIDFILIISKV